MEPRIEQRYNNAVLREAQQRYGIDETRIRVLDGFENFIYEFERDGETYVLRISHSLRRSAAWIRGELDWLNYLAAGGIPVSKAIASENGELVEVIADGQGGHFLAAAFVKANGKLPGKEEWNSTLFKRYGQVLGRIHTLSKGYEPREREWRRPHWNDAQMLEVERLLPPSEWRVVERFRELIAYLESLPRDRQCYGLIHQDAHARNFFVDEAGNLTLFDFDDCAYSWFMNDIAIVLFYAVTWVEDAVAFTPKFMEVFLQGYQEENRLEPMWVREIPYFLKLREIDLYALLHRSFDVQALSDPWDLKYMYHRKERIEDGLPYIDFDFEVLVDYMG